MIHQVSDSYYRQHIKEVCWQTNPRGHFSYHFYHRGLVTPDTVIVGSVDFKVIRTGRYFRVHDCALLCICSDPRITISFQPVFEAVFFRDMIIVGRKLKTEVYLVIIKKILTDTKVVKLNLLLSFLNCIGKHLVLNLFILCNTKRCKDLHQSLRTEQTHQVIFQGNIETGFTRISLTSGTSAKLIINTSGLMTFCTDDHQTTCISCHIIQLDICTTTSHVSGDRNCSCLTCL